MLIVGYGDIYPRTHVGRIICILACMCGIFVLSLFIVALTNTATFSSEEE